MPDSAPPNLWHTLDKHPKPRHERMPHPFPPHWFSAYGDDQYGLWAELTWPGEGAPLVQRMRWIEPGQFVMGSPEDEAGRWTNEGPQHFVSISQGFWLADTACTQAWWQAVMGVNPSRFSADNGGGPHHPVDNVSWNRVQDFLRKLQANWPGCQPGLPTEAEWEYACRAGTAIPFWFGPTITTEQVNFDGNFHYGDAEKGEYRERTVPVKALPANGWGLYQMHGNVWEWCADPLVDYTADPATDPGLAEALAPSRGELARVVRGGSWFNRALGVRSAYRSCDKSDDQIDNTGFRFALRGSGPASRG